MKVMLHKAARVEVLEEGTTLTRVQNEGTDNEYSVRTIDLREVPAERKPRLTLLQQHRNDGRYVEYVNSEEREHVAYDATRNPEAHEFLMAHIADSFAKETGWAEVHAPLSHPTVSAELAVLMGVSVQEAEQCIVWGEGGLKGEAHSPTYNLHLPNPNRLGLDDDLKTNLNHRHGLARVQIGKQDLVKLVIVAGFQPRKVAGIERS